jgi:hypothetical protein
VIAKKLKEAKSQRKMLEPGMPDKYQFLVKKLEAPRFLTYPASIFVVCALKSQRRGGSHSEFNATPEAWSSRAIRNLDGLQLHWRSSSVGRQGD